MRFFQLALVATILLFGKVTSTGISECWYTHGGALPDEVTLEPCGRPCTIYINSTEKVSVKFKAPRDLEHIGLNTLGRYLNGEVLFNLPIKQDDACQSITNTECPLKENDEVEYNLEFNVPKPPFSTDYAYAIEFSFVDKDQGDAVFICFSVNVVFSEK